MAIGTFLRRAITHNMGLKLLSLAAAIFLFSLVRGSQDTQVSMFIDVQAVLPPEANGKMLISELPARVRVSVRGASSRVARLEHPPIRIDVTDTNRRYYHFGPEAFRFPAGVRVIDWEPRSVPLMWSDTTERQVSVLPRLRGEPPAGLELQGEVRVVPSEVTVRGPVRTVSLIDTVHTDRIALSEFSVGRHEERIRLEPLPDHTRYVDASLASVSFELVPQVAERAFAAQEVVQLGGENVAQIRPTRVSVVVQGEPAVLEALTPEQVIPFVNATQVNAGGGAQAVSVAIHTLPNGATLARIDPPAVLVTLPRDR